ncbi:MAG: prohibitin family protein [Candidatus Zixiibacteriota bacterium]
MTTPKPTGRSVVILLIVGIIVIAFMAHGCGTTVPSGHHAVKYSKFGGGTKMGSIYGEGWKWKLPWDSFFVYKTQLDERKEDLRVLSSDGATIELEVSVWFRPLIEKIDSLQITVGPNYYNVIVGSALRGEARAVAGRYKPEEIYSTKRELIAREIVEAVQKLVGDKFVRVDNIIIRNVILPKRISDAIDEKLAADQAAQKMQFVLQRERQEAERKRIEAKGIADFQRIVSAGLTKSLLEWKGIEATEKLASSQNAKVVIIGAGESGLPIILGGG